MLHFSHTPTFLHNHTFHHYTNSLSHHPLPPLPPIAPPAAPPPPNKYSLLNRRSPPPEQKTPTKKQKVDTTPPSPRLVKKEDPSGQEVGGRVGGPDGEKDEKVLPYHDPDGSPALPVPTDSSHHSPDSPSKSLDSSIPSTLSPSRVSGSLQSAWFVLPGSAVYVTNKPDNLKVRVTSLIHNSTLPLTYTLAVKRSQQPPTHRRQNVRSFERLRRVFLLAETDDDLLERTGRRRTDRNLIGQKFIPLTQIPAGVPHIEMRAVEGTTREGGFLIYVQTKGADRKAKGRQRPLTDRRLPQKYINLKVGATYELHIPKHMPQDLKVEKVWLENYEHGPLDIPHCCGAVLEERIEEVETEEGQEKERKMVKDEEMEGNVRESLKKGAERDSGWGSKPTVVSLRLPPRPFLSPTPSLSSASSLSCSAGANSFFSSPSSSPSIPLSRTPMDRKPFFPYPPSIGVTTAFPYSSPQFLPFPGPLAPASFFTYPSSSSTSSPTAYPRLSGELDPNEVVVGIYTRAERAAKIARFKEKKARQLLKDSSPQTSTLTPFVSPLPPRPPSQMTASSSSSPSVSLHQQGRGVGKASDSKGGLQSSHQTGFSIIRPLVSRFPSSSPSPPLSAAPSIPRSDHLPAPHSHIRDFLPTSSSSSPSLPKTVIPSAFANPLSSRFSPPSSPSSSIVPLADPDEISSDEDSETEDKSGSKTTAPHSSPSLIRSRIPPYSSPLPPSASLPSPYFSKNPLGEGHRSMETDRLMSAVMSRAAQKKATGSGGGKVALPSLPLHPKAPTDVPCSQLPLPQACDGVKE